MRLCALTLILLALSGTAHAQTAASAEPDAQAVLAALPFLDADGKKRARRRLPRRVRGRAGFRRAPGPLPRPEALRGSGAGAAENEAVVDLTVVSNRPGVNVKLNGRALKLLLDTGAPQALMLSGPHARQAEIDFEQGPACSVLGTVGSTRCHVSEVARVELGTLVLERQQALVAPNGFYNLGFAGDSLLGYALLEHFLVRIDYPRERLWLRRAARASADGSDPEQLDLP